MSAEDAVKFFRELGFPAAVAAFVLWRLEARLGELTKAVAELRLCLLRVPRRGTKPTRSHTRVAPPPEK